MSVTVYGVSDDLIEVEGDVREEFTALKYGPDEDDGGYLAFSDGSVLRIRYDDDGVWRITPVVTTPMALSVLAAPVGDEGNYSDRATLDSDIRWVVLGTNYAGAQRKATA